MNVGEKTEGYSKKEILELFGNGEYKEIMGNPLIRELRDDIENGNYMSEKIINKWRGLKIKASRTHKFGREFPDTVIDVGLDLFEGIIGEYVEMIKKGPAETDMGYVARVMLDCIKEYKNLLNLKLDKNRYEDGGIACIMVDNQSAEDIVKRSMKLDSIVSPIFGILEKECVNNTSE